MRLQTPLLVSKLQMPRLPFALVAREQLLARLDAGLACKLTLISAPAGWGKTTLVGQWLSARRLTLSALRSELSQTAPSQNATFKTQTLDVAWVSLDPADNDPFRFWRYVIAACGVFQDNFGHSALSLLQTVHSHPFKPPSLEPALTLFLNELAQLNQYRILVLDDYHVITMPQIHETLALVLKHLPSTLHLVLMTRSEPPLSLAQLRANGALNELHAVDLHFSHDEVCAFLSQALPFQLSADAISHLEVRTEGWAAGLRLATLALQGRASPAAIAPVLAALSGSQQPFVEYLTSAVLYAQDAILQTFLLQTSILEHLTSSLCDAVTERNDSADLLAQIERANLFLLPLDDRRGWYRYHTLFAEAMQHLAHHRLGEDALLGCYRRASVWYEQHGLLAAAIDSLLAAHEWVRAVALMEQLIDSRPIMDPYEPHTLRRWLEQLPAAVLHESPLLCFSSLFVQLRTSGRPPAAIVGQLEPLAQLAEQGWRRSGNMHRVGEVLAARGLAALWQGQLDTAIGWARQALSYLPADDLAWRGICLGFVGKSELREGQLDLARQTLLDARMRCETVGDGYALRPTLIMLGEVCIGQGELHQAAAYYRQALESALQHSDRSDQIGAQVGLALLAYEWNDLDGAEREAQAALNLSEQLKNEMLRVQAVLALACAKYAQGAKQSAYQQLATLLAHLHPHRSPLLYRSVLANQARLQLAAGDLAAVQRWVSSRTQYEAVLPAPQQEQEELLVARLLLAQGHTEDALHMLERWRDAADAAGRSRSSMSIQVLMALAYAAQQQGALAGRMICEVIARAATEGHRRLFLDEGAALSDLLRALIPTLHEQPLRIYTQALLQMLVLEQAGPRLAISLTPQEHRVLALLATGRSNAEIAAEFVVSVNTVKTQLKHIYRKLGVTSRHEACAIARQLQLL